MADRYWRRTTGSTIAIRRRLRQRGAWNGARAVKRLAVGAWSSPSGRSGADTRRELLDLPRHVFIRQTREYTLEIFRDGRVDEIRQCSRQRIRTDLGIRASQDVHVVRRLLVVTSARIVARLGYTEHVGGRTGVDFGTVGGGGAGGTGSAQRDKRRSDGDIFAAAVSERRSPANAQIKCAPRT